MENTSTYTCVEPIDHNGELYKPGDAIELSNKDAEPLIVVGAVADVAPQVSKPAAKATSKTASK